MAGPTIGDAQLRKFDGARNADRVYIVGSAVDLGGGGSSATTQDREDTQDLLHLFKASLNISDATNIMYDSAGNIISADYFSDENESNLIFTRAFTYDTDNRRLSETRTDETNNKQLIWSYTYDSDGRLTDREIKKGTK